MVRARWLSYLNSQFNRKLPSIQEITAWILGITDETTKIFCIIAYLGLARISEVCNYKQENYYRKAKRDNKGQTVKDDKGKTIYERVHREVIIVEQGIRKKNIEISTKEVEKDYSIEVLSMSMRNEKNKTQPDKTVFAPIHYEHELVDCLINYLKNLDDDSIVIPYSRKVIYNRFKKYCPQLLYPHFLRALRIGVLLQVYGLEEYQIMELAGWTDLRPFKSYYVFRSNPAIFRKFYDAEKRL